MGKNVAWNGLEIVKINHTLYLNTVKKCGIERWSLQPHFEYELHCLNECLKGMDPFLNCELDTNSFDDPNLKLQTFNYNENVKDIFKATIGHQFKCTYSTHALIFECFN